jgi:hypothetical protein
MYAGNPFELFLRQVSILSFVHRFIAVFFNVSSSLLAASSCRSILGVVSILGLPCLHCTTTQYAFFRMASVIGLQSLASSYYAAYDAPAIYARAPAEKSELVR